MRRAVLLVAAMLGCGDPGSSTSEDDGRAGSAFRVGVRPRAELLDVQVKALARPWPKVELVAAPELADALVAIDGARVPESSFAALFASLARDSAPLCRHQHMNTPVSLAQIERYIQPAGTYRGALPRTRRSMISGCWNFVRMNDQRPDRDLELVDALYQASSYDCTAVGVMQPYLMQHVLGCARLTMLDFDWQIHRVHAQLLDAARRRSFGEDPEPALAAMEVDWIAYHYAHEGQTLSLAKLCGPEMGDLCRAALLGDQDSLAGVATITLALAGLHEAPFEAVPAGRLRVVYLSNALERAYTSRAEFHQMMDRLAAVMGEDEVCVIIHHAGGTLGFGLYEVRREGEGWRVDTRCRDPYFTSVSSSEATYTTWLEGVSQDAARVPACAELLAAPTF